MSSERFGVEVNDGLPVQVEEIKKRFKKQKADREAFFCLIAHFLLEVIPHILRKECKE